MVSKLPLFPRLRPIFTVLPAAGGVILDGLKEIDLLKGTVAETIVPYIVPFCDGQTNLDSIVNRCSGISRAHIEAALVAMLDLGLLEDGATMSVCSDDGEGPYLARVEAIYGGQKLRTETGRQAYSRIILAGGSLGGRQIVALVRDLLVRASTVPVEVDDCRTTSDGFGNVMGIRLCSDVTLGANELNKDLELDISIVRFAKELLIRSVPCIGVKGSNCGDLFYRDLLGTEENDLRLFCASTHLAIASFMAAEIMNCLLRLPHSLSGRMARQYDLSTFSSIVSQYPRSWNCKGCNPETTNPHTDANDAYDAAWVYDERVGVGARRERSLRGTKRYAAGSRGETATPTDMVQCPRTSAKFTSLSLDALRSAEGKRITSLEQLAAIAALSVGLRELGTPPKRWAPSAGNRGASRLYLLSGDIAGLSDGVYRYDELAHAFAKIHVPDSIDVAAQFRRDGATLLAFVANRQALESKYGTFSYRLGALDCGCAFAQAQLIASALGLATHALESWPTREVAASLGVDRFIEHPAVILSLQKRPWRFPFTSDAWYSSAMSEKRPASIMREASTDQLVDWMVTSHSESIDVKHPTATRNTGKATPEGRKLPLPRAGGKSMDDLLRHRFSTRDFSSTPLNLEELSTLLYCAASRDRREWPTSIRFGMGLSYYVLCRCVDSMPRGAFRYIPNGHSLHYIGVVPADNIVRELYVQQECVSAPVTIIICATLERACAIGGSSGLNSLYVRAGAAGQRISLAAIAQGLSTAVLAGVVPEVAARLFDISDISEVPLIASVVGHPLATSLALSEGYYAEA